jgi:hypothetical protein
VRRILGTPAGAYLPALGLWLLTAIYLDMSYGYKPLVREFPAGVAWVMIILLTLDLASRTQTRLGRTLTRWLNPAADAPQPDRAAAREVSAILWIAGFTALLMLAGILCAVPLFIFATMRFRARRPYGTSLLAAAGATLVIWLLFEQLLRLSLYSGPLFGGT